MSPDRPSGKLASSSRLGQSGQSPCSVSYWGDQAAGPAEYRPRHDTGCHPGRADVYSSLLSQAAGAASPGRKTTCRPGRLPPCGPVRVQDNNDHAGYHAPRRAAPPAQVADDELVDTVLAASRALVAVAARSLAAAGDEVTLPQYRALVVLAAHGPQEHGRAGGGAGGEPVDDDADVRPAGAQGPGPPPPAIW